MDACIVTCIVRNHHCCHGLKNGGPKKPNESLPHPPMDISKMPAKFNIWRYSSNKNVEAWSVGNEYSKQGSRHTVQEGGGDLC